MTVASRSALKYHKHQRQKFQEFLLGTLSRPKGWTNEEIEARMTHQLTVINDIKKVRNELFPRYKLDDDDYDAEIRSRLNECAA